MNKIVKIVIVAVVIVLLGVGFFLFFNPFLVVKLEGDSLIEIDYNEAYTEPGYSASIYGKKITDKVKVEGTIDTAKVGSYKISYRVKSGLTEKIVNRIVLVQDNVAPILSLQGEASVAVCPNKDYEEEGYSAIDDYDGDITSSVEVVKNDGVITYIAKDSSGNESKLERILNTMDNEKPVITLKGVSDVKVLLNSTYNDQGAIAKDNCDEDISDSMTVKNNVNTSQVGVYEVEYNVTDSTGNTTTAKRIVRVVEKEEETEWYSNIIQGPTYINGILIVNKKYSIPSSFGGSNETANQALYKLQDDAKALGFTANVVSGYRSYSTQQSTYNYWVSVYGKKDADTISARPGHSEHQTGLAFDITSLDSSYGETEEGIWLRENCAKYGFIIRYPKGKEHITGYAYEPWHIRYVGVEEATYIMDNDLTLEEYLGVA